MHVYGCIITDVVILISGNYYLYDAHPVVYLVTLRHRGILKFTMNLSNLFLSIYSERNNYAKLIFWLIASIQTAVLFQYKYSMVF